MEKYRCPSCGGELFDSGQDERLEEFVIWGSCYDCGEEAQIVFKAMDLDPWRCPKCGGECDWDMDEEGEFSEPLSDDDFVTYKFSFLDHGKEVNDIGRLLPRHKFNRHIKMPADDLVHRRLQLRHLLIRRAAGELVVTLGLLPLDVRIPGPRTPEHLHHRSIQNMLGRMHRRILFLIMRVQNRLFHEIIC